MDGRAHAHGHALQDTRCHPAHQAKQTQRPEVQHADVLVHRTCGKRHQGVPYASCRAEGEVSSCDVPFSDNLQHFNADYLRLTKQEWEASRQLELRPLAERDIPEMQALFRDTVLHVNVRDYSLEEVEDWASCGDSVEHWCRLLSENAFVGAFDAQGRLAGFSSMNADGHLHSMFVHKDRQGRGVAGSLLSEVEKMAHGYGVRIIGLEASVTARPFFEAHGYSVVKELCDGEGVMKVLKSLVVWLCFIPAAILNGGLREYVLAPVIGQKWALPVSGIILSVCIFLITWLLLPRLMKVLTSGADWLIGICWLILTVAFEFASGLAGGTSLAELLSAYNPLTGNLWLLVLASTLFAPVLESAMRRRKLRLRRYIHSCQNTDVPRSSHR